MNNNTISQKQGIVMMALFIIGTSSLKVMGLEAKTDIWISILVAIVASALIMFIYIKLLTALPDKDFFETIGHYFGKIGSKIILVLLIWFCFDLCAIVLRNYGEFVVTVGLPETPLTPAMFVVMAVAVFSVRSGIEAVGRWSSTFIFFVVGFMIISTLLVIPRMDINNLLPIYEGGALPIAKGALGVVAFPLAETVVFLLVFPALKKGVSIKKIYLIALLIGGITILISSVTDILVIGSTMAENTYYPTYATMATVHFGEFLQRFEIIAAIIFIIAVFLKLTIALFAATNGVARLFGFKDSRFIVLPMALLILVYVMISFDSMIYFHDWGVKVWPYYAPVFEIVIPLIMLIIIKIRQAREKSKKSHSKSKAMQTNSI